MGCNWSIIATFKYIIGSKFSTSKCKLLVIVKLRYIIIRYFYQIRHILIAKAIFSNSYLNEELPSMDIIIRHPRFYATNFISNHIKKKYCEVFSKRILIMFAPEEAEISKDYLFILARFSVRLHLFSDDFKRFFVF
jgi:hypothetical protein